MGLDYSLVNSRPGTRMVPKYAPDPGTLPALTPMQPATSDPNYTGVPGQFQRPSPSPAEADFAKQTQANTASMGAGTAYNEGMGAPPAITIMKGRQIGYVPGQEIGGEGAGYGFAAPYGTLQSANQAANMLAKGAAMPAPLGENATPAERDAYQNRLAQLNQQYGTAISPEMEKATAQGFPEQRAAMAELLRQKSREGFDKEMERQARVHLGDLIKDPAFVQTHDANGKALPAAQVHPLIQQLVNNAYMNAPMGSDSKTIREELKPQLDEAKNAIKFDTPDMRSKAAQNWEKYQTSLDSRMKTKDQNGVVTNPLTEQEQATYVPPGANRKAAINSFLTTPINLSNYKKWQMASSTTHVTPPAAGVSNLSPGGAGQPGNTPVLGNMTPNITREDIYNALSIPQALRLKPADYAAPQWGPQEYPLVEPFKK